MTDLIDAHLRHLEAAGRSGDTIDDRRKVLRRLDRELPYGLTRAATEELEQWFAAGRTPAGRPWSRQTRATYFTHTAGFYSWAVRHRYLDWDPSSEMMRPTVPRGVPHPASDEQLADILTRAARPWRTAVILAAYAGMRAGEVARATREQLARDPIRITGKGAKTRAVPRHPAIAEELDHLPPGPVFLTQTGLPVDGDWVARAVSAYLTELGHRELTLHWFRHWFGTTTLRHCGDLRVVQELMGHASPATTAVYTHVTSEQRRIAVAALPALATAAA
jgi:integrase/recombinase XerC